jgi:cytochrome c553
MRQQNHCHSLMLGASSAALSATVALLAALVCTSALAQGKGNETAAPDGKAELETVRRAVHVCAACHGEGGRSATVVYPRLAGQQALYTVAQLRDFRSQKRAETGTQAYMWGVSALLDDATIEGLADYYSQQTPAPARPVNAADKASVEAGRKIFAYGLPARARACADCHGENAEGAAGFPRLAGQHADYVFRQLKVFGTRLRPHGVIMKSEAANMTTAEMKAVAAYVASR